MKFDILTIFSAQFSGIKCLHNDVRPSPLFPILCITPERDSVGAANSMGPPLPLPCLPPLWASSRCWREAAVGLPSLNGCRAVHSSGTWSHAQASFLLRDE